MIAVGVAFAQEQLVALVKATAAAPPPALKLGRARDQRSTLRRRLGFGSGAGGVGAGLRPRPICLASAWRYEFRRSKAHSVVEGGIGPPAASPDKGRIERDRGGAGRDARIAVLEMLRNAVQQVTRNPDIGGIEAAGAEPQETVDPGRAWNGPDAKIVPHLSCSAACLQSCPDPTIRARGCGSPRRSHPAPRGRALFRQRAGFDCRRPPLQAATRRQKWSTFLLSLKSIWGDTGGGVQSARRVGVTAALVPVGLTSWSGLSASPTAA
jgi:hypothetical protein